MVKNRRFAVGSKGGVGGWGVCVEGHCDVGLVGLGVRYFERDKGTERGCGEATKATVKRELRGAMLVIPCRVYLVFIQR